MRWLSAAALLVASSLSVGAAAEPSVDRLDRARRFLDAWVAAKDASTSLVPTRNGVWSVDGSAADVYATALAAAAIADPPRLNGLLRETLRDESTLTVRLLSLPDDYDVGAGRFTSRQTDPHRITRNAVRYAARLLWVARITGRTEWTDRARQIVDDVYTLAAIDAPATGVDASPLPSDRLDINGPLLSILPQLSRLTGDSSYLQRARRMADVYAAEVLPNNAWLVPRHWNFPEKRAQDPVFPLDEAGSAFLMGMASLAGEDSSSTELPQTDATTILTVRETALQNLFDQVFRHGLRGTAMASTLAPVGQDVESAGENTPHWAAVLLAAHTEALISSDPVRIRRVVTAATSILRSPIAGATVSFPQVTSLIAAIDPAAELMYTFPDIDRCFESDLPTDLLTAAKAVQNDLALFWHTSAGVRLDRQSPGVDVDAVMDADTLTVTLRADADWEGRILLDRLAPLEVVGFPARFSLDPSGSYALRISPRERGGVAIWTGSLLSEGIEARLDSGSVNVLAVWPVVDTNEVHSPECASNSPLPPDFPPPFSR